jgi:hypothetical protein
MLQIKKRKKLYKQQLRTSNGKFGPKKLINNENELTDGNVNDYIELNIAEGWDDDGSGWEDDIELEKEKEIQSKLTMLGLGKYFYLILI